MIRRPNTTRRPGIASLELALIFPLLLCLVVALFIISRVTVVRCQAIEEARLETWKTRPAADDGDELGLKTDPMASEVGFDAKRRYRPGLFFGTTEFKGEAHSRVVGRPWDHTSLPFAAGKPPFQAHDHEARLVAKNYGQESAVAAVLKPFPVLLAFGSFAPTAALGALNAAMNPLIRLAATALELAKPVLVAAAAVARVLQLIAIARWHFSEARMWGRVANLMGLALTGVDNLDKASRGLPVGWPSDMPNRIRRATP